MLYGVVREEESGRPVPGALVFIEAARAGAKTDSRGRYEIRRLDPGTYVVQAQSIGYGYEERRTVKLDLAGYLIVSRNDSSGSGIQPCETEELNFYLRHNRVF